jgi:hypothetical protein
MRRVRDETIGDWERMVTGRMRGATAQWCRGVIGTLAVHDRAKLIRIMPAIVDAVLCHALRLFEEEETIRIGVRTDGHATDDLARQSDGLCGEVFGSDGWIARFSKYPAEWADTD